MYFSNGFVYAGEPLKSLKVECVEPLENFELSLRFSTGEKKIFDMKPLLEKPVYAPLKNEKLFNRVYLDYGIPSWNDGEIDIAPERLYENSVDVKKQNIA